MVLIVDNYGTSANITAAMVRSLGFDAAILPCNTDSLRVNIRDYSAVIITAGPGNFDRNGLGCSLVDRQGTVPILGVCQGMDMIVGLYGGSVSDTATSMCEDTLSHTGEGLFSGISQRFRAVLRQPRVIDKKTLPAVFEAEAYSSCGTVQSISISDQKVYATGFDPSNYRTENGLKILYNFINL